MKTDSQLQTDVGEELKWEPQACGMPDDQDKTFSAERAMVSAVKADIETALKRTVAADAKKIHVDVNGSNVTLTGKVQSWAERETATTSAWGSPGVRSVVDKMTLDY